MCRAKAKAVKEGTVILSLLERAKLSLADRGNNVDKLLGTHNYDNLTTAELTQLRESARRKNSRAIKREGAGKVAAEEEKKVLPNEDSAAIDAERLNHMINTFFDEFNLDPTTTCLKRQNTQNQVAFYQSILSLAISPDDNFLSMLSDVIASEEKFDQQLRLFHGFCTLYDGKWMGTFDQLCVPAVQYFAVTEQAVTHHALGFLRYIFVNGVDLSCPVATADAFDDKFSHVWGQLANLLRKNALDSSVFKFLPPTILIMRAPMIEALKNESLVAIPPDFLRVALRVLTYSCIWEQDLFDQLLLQFKDPLTLQYNAAESASFITLCQHLALAMETRNKLWFGKPLAIIGLLEGAHELIQKGKVPGGCFTKDLCQDLLNGKCVKQFIDRPSYKKHSSDDNELSQSMLAVNESNKTATAAIKSLESSNKSEIILLFEHLKLNPSPVQEVCIKLIQAYPRLFLCPAAGTGKSTLILALAIEAAAQGHQVIVMNPLPEMLLRDYASLCKFLEQMKSDIEVQLLQDLIVRGLICFMTSEQILKVQLPVKYHLLVDEFQIELYNEQRAFALLPVFREAVSVTAFSGSPVQKQHIKYLQYFLTDAVVIRFPDIYANSLVQKHAQICTTLKLQVQLAANLAEQQRKLSPTILIMEQDAIAVYQTNKVVKAVIQQATVMLCKLDAIDFTQALETQQFCSTINGLYKIYIVSREHGTGVDYPTTAAINATGGNSLIVCTRPNSYGELFQFRRRVARMGAPGTVGYVFHDKGSGEDSNYVNSIEEALRMRDALLMERLLTTLQAEHQEVAPWKGEVLFKLEESDDSDDDDEDEDEESEEEVGCAECGDDPVKLRQCLTCHKATPKVLEKAGEQNESLLFDPKVVGKISDAEEMGKEQIKPKDDQENVNAQGKEDAEMKDEEDKADEKNVVMEEVSVQDAKVNNAEKLEEKESVPQIKSTKEPPMMNPLEQKAIFQQPANDEQSDMIYITEEHSHMQYPDGTIQQTTKRSFQQTFSTIQPPIKAHGTKGKKKEGGVSKVPVSNLLDEDKRNQFDSESSNEAEEEVKKQATLYSMTPAKSASQQKRETKMDDKQKKKEEKKAKQQAVHQASDLDQKIESRRSERQSHNYKSQ